MTRKFFFLSLLVVNLAVYINASIIPNSNGLGGRLGPDVLNPNMVKTPQFTDDQRLQHLNTIEPFMTNLDEPLNNENDRKNDNAHFSLFYKSNSPGQLVTHELEHRFRKNPSNVFSSNPYLTRSSSLQNYDRPNNLDSSSSLRYLPNNNINNLPYKMMNNQRNDKNRQTLFNIHYHDNLENGNLN